MKKPSYLKLSVTFPFYLKDCRQIYFAGLSIILGLYLMIGQDGALPLSLFCAVSLYISFFCVCDKGIFSCVLLEVFLADFRD